ncbi:LeuA family protein [Streptomyces acidiscabies]|uniref:LeuA family protein n=1 Tax=Streptomyces acidiscabies TaxID=42234 RepID=UPI00073E5CF7|nr:pyruvate carboxyltransferase [Streptomyces acidiscabies]GAQ50764.1 2-isopropylmalate synthase [Streptomyces acidiscabies]GAV39214.1 2-isopropylmalate synthase [Streptomyces acidiscabies]
MTIDRTYRRRRISVFDATLRDGEQAPGNAMSPQQKLPLALAAEAYGADIVEAGFPGSSPADAEATRLIAESLTTARFATFNRASTDDVRASMAAGGARSNHQVQICGTGSDLHLEHKRGITRAESVQEVRDAIRLAVDLGAADISFGVEDASRGSKDHIEALVTAAVEDGATTVILADTTGCATPQEYGDLCASVRSWIPDDVVLSTHCHDDMGLSLANALAGIQAGADEVQATLGGIGERAGNTPLEELASVLRHKGDQFGASIDIQLDGLYPAYLLLSETIALAPSRNKAVFGVNAFATEAGIHQAGILKNPINYEYLNPHLYGRERSLLVGRHSGRSILRYLLDRMGVPAEQELVEGLYEEFVASRPPGECDELGDLAQRIAGRFTEAAKSS